MYVAAQHPNSSSPFYHFASFRLRTEGAKELTGIHTQMSSTMSVLSRAHKRDLIDLVKLNADTEQRLVAEQAQLAHAQRELAKVQEELLNRDTLIADLQRGLRQ